MAERIKMPFGLWTLQGPENSHVLDGVQIRYAMGRGNFWGRAHCKVMHFYRWNQVKVISLALYTSHRPKNLPQKFSCVGRDITACYNGITMTV